MRGFCLCENKCILNLMTKSKKLINNFDATDLIAILIIMGGFVLLAMGIDTVVGGAITMVAGFYFGRKSDGKK